MCVDLFPAHGKQYTAMGIFKQHDPKLQVPRKPCTGNTTEATSGWPILNGADRKPLERWIWLELVPDGFIPKLSGVEAKYVKVINWCDIADSRPTNLGISPTERMSLQHGNIRRAPTGRTQSNTVSWHNLYLDMTYMGPWGARTSDVICIMLIYIFFSVSSGAEPRESWALVTENLTMEIPNFFEVNHSEHPGMFHCHGQPLPVVVVMCAATQLPCEKWYDLTNRANPTNSCLLLVGCSHLSTTNKDEQCG